MSFILVRDNALLGRPSHSERCAKGPGLNLEMHEPQQKNSLIVSEHGVSCRSPCSKDPNLGIGRRGLLEKRSFQKGPCLSLDSRDSRDCRDSRESSRDSIGPQTV